MKEFLREKRGALALTVAFGLGASACGGANASSKPKEAPTLSANGVTIHTQYFSNGVREQTIESDATDSNNGFDVNIVEFCDGKDLVSVANGDLTTTLPTRTVNYPGCVDGKLTPSDFQIPPTSTTIAK